MSKLFLILTILCVPMVALAEQQGEVTLKGTDTDSKISGEIILTEENGGITLEAKLADVPPGKHGFHIHENGSCEDMGKAAGGHFNPDKVEHGLLPKDGPMKSHAGDMGNIQITEDGTGSLKIFLPDVSLTEGKYAVLGKTIILHEKEDDFSQPTGNAGGRIGCGVIKLEENK